MSDSASTPATADAPEASAQDLTKRFRGWLVWSIALAAILYIGYSFWVGIDDVKGAIGRYDMVWFGVALGLTVGWPWEGVARGPWVAPRGPGGATRGFGGGVNLGGESPRGKFSGAPGSQRARCHAGYDGGADVAGIIGGGPEMA